MADDIRKVGIELTAQGAKDFTQSMRDIKGAVSEAYSELKLAQSQYDKNTSAVDKLKDRQKYLGEVTEQYSKRANCSAANSRRWKARRTGTKRQSAKSARS